MGGLFAVFVLFLGYIMIELTRTGTTVWLYYWTLM